MAVLEAMAVILALTSVSSDELSQLLAACEAERAQLLSETASAEVESLRSPDQMRMRIAVH
eukprot:m.204026 g.204026  ORF g.204026 m.204026 type:complete len:61 (-) comp15379_c0_seq2:2432-2614(-)